MIVRGLQVDDRRLGFRRQVIADLGQLRLDLSERRVGIVIELQVHGNRAEALSARRLHVVDSVSAGDDALQRCRDKAADQVRVGAHVNRRDLHHGDVAARILPDAQRADGLQPGNQNHQVDYDREDRPLDKKISKLHLAVLRLGSRIVPRLDLIVDLDGGAVTQFEDARAHNLITGIDT